MKHIMCIQNVSLSTYRFFLKKHTDICETKEIDFEGIKLYTTDFLSSCVVCVGFFFLLLHN